MNAAHALKRLAAIVLLIAFFLPLSRCTLEELDPQTKAVKQTVSVTYAYNAHRWPSTEAFEHYAAFLWPLVLATACLIWPALNRKLTVGLVEIVFCLASAFILFRLTFGGEVLYGAYVAAGSIGVYLLTVLVQLAARARQWWARRSAVLASR